MAQRFDPNVNTFAACVVRVFEAVRNTELERIDRIITSQDGNVMATRERLYVRNLPDGSGIEKWQLPFFFAGGTHLFISESPPGAKVPEHAHNDGAALRVVVSGSVIYDEKELGPGDWMYIPAGVPYSLEIGQEGAIVFYCYEC